ncbi:MAG: hypothetical protein FWE88_06355 [Phycisphaerae bacterium]|nr:hypothetical protein [Phycisphaerae bacterium]
MKWLFWYGGGVVGAALLVGWMIWSIASPPTFSHERAAFEAPAGATVPPRDVLLYVALAVLGAWLIALIVAASLRMWRDSREIKRDTEADEPTP